MSEKNIKSAGDYVRDFIDVLKSEIQGLKKLKENNISLENGILHKEVHGTFTYRFDAGAVISPSDSVVYRLLADGDEIDCVLENVDNNQIYLQTERKLSVGGEITLYIDRTALPEKLLKCFQDTQKGAGARYDSAARIFNGQFQKINNENPDLSGYLQLNEFQKAAVVRSVQGHTVIWGPPGTGKTKTIAVAINEQIKRGKRVLLLSHANTAVDGAMEELAELLHGEDIYQDGKLVRIGVSQLDKYPMLSLEQIMKAKEESLYQMIEELNLRMVPLQEELSRLNHLNALYLEVVHQHEELSGLLELNNQQAATIERSEKDIEKDKHALLLMEVNLEKYQKKLLQTQRVQSQIRTIELEISRCRSSLAMKGDAVRQVKVLKSDTVSKIVSLQDDITKSERKLNIEMALAGLDVLDLSNKIKQSEKTIGHLENEAAMIKEEIAGLKKQIIEDAKVIGATLSMAYMYSELQAKRYDTLFIDEISMAPLMTMFYAIGLTDANCIFIGDFLQLPPIDSKIDDVKVKEWMNRSFFDLIGINTVEKAQTNEFVKPLSIQYRMNPAIAALPNRLFYNGLLRNGENTKSNIYSDQWTQAHPIALVDTSSVQPWMNKGKSGKSRCNLYHANLAAAMARNYAEADETITIGVVVPYAPQKDLIISILEGSIGDESIRKRIEVNTVHSFQGGEKDIIICDSVESEGFPTKWYFFDDHSNSQNAHLMLNVAITRAKRKFILLANNEYITKMFRGQHLKKIIEIICAEGIVLPAASLDGAYHTAEEDMDLGTMAESSSVKALSFHNQHGFWPRFIPDLLSAKGVVIIFCPFVREGRIQYLLPHFEKLKGGGVNIIVYTRSVREHSEKYQPKVRSIIDDLRRRGIIVLTRTEMHEKVIVIDHRIVWQGSLNLLSHKSTSEQMQRIEGENYSEKTINILDLEKYNKIRLPLNPEMKCELCGGEIKERVNTISKAQFYGCSNFPDCGFARSK